MPLLAAQTYHQHPVASPAMALQGNATYEHFSSSVDSSSKSSSSIASAAHGQVNANKTGIGSASSSSTNPSKAPNESSSVYVAGLPPDITTEELRKFLHSLISCMAQSVTHDSLSLSEILFGISGKVPIKKIKIYVNAKGQKKGDALVTFHRSDHAATACLHFDGLDIGDGYRIKVSKASFTANSSSSARSAGSYDDVEVISLLPEPAMADKHPIVIIRQRREEEVVSFSSSIDDLLVECCIYGELLALLPVSDPDFPDMILAAVAIYAAVEDANTCSAAVDARSLADGSRYTTSVHLPSKLPSHDDSASAQHPVPLSAPASDFKEGGENHVPSAVEDADDDVDAFLNSLL
jgi:hypothetical protein